jgi:hypothetical protein
MRIAGRQFENRKMAKRTTSDSKAIQKNLVSGMVAFVNAPFVRALHRKKLMALDRRGRGHFLDGSMIPLFYDNVRGHVPDRRIR